MLGEGDDDGAVVTFGQVDVLAVAVAADGAGQGAEGCDGGLVDGVGDDLADRGGPQALPDGEDSL